MPSGIEFTENIQTKAIECTLYAGDDIDYEMLITENNEAETIIPTTGMTAKFIAKQKDGTEILSLESPTNITIGGSNGKVTLSADGSVSSEQVAGTKGTYEFQLLTSAGKLHSYFTGPIKVATRLEPIDND